jgi:DUF4097 and DUF4098 domain-containing protein YvlB
MTSGNLDIKDLIFNNLYIILTSGNADINNVTVNNNLDFDAVSGGLNANNIKVLALGRFGITSGNIKIESSEILKISADSTSGNIKLDEIKTSEIKAMSTSGNIDVIVEGTSVDYKTDLDVTSGSIYYLGNKVSKNVFNREKSKEITLYATSGNIKLNFTNG